MTTNPYIGPRAFEQNETQYFFGRDQEVEILTGQVMARRASLLFAQSGAGKSSLLRAGLLPELTRQETIGRGHRKRTYQKMAVLPVLTVGSGIPGQVSREIRNVYSFSALLTLLPQADPNELVELSLSDGLFRYFQIGADERASVTTDSALLIFDQFEEIFTHHPTQRAHRHDFFRQVSETLDKHSVIHVLFSMREDFIARLTPHERVLPEPLQSRFRLEPLQPAAALTAIINPASQADRTFAAGVAEALVDNLRRTQASAKSPIADTTILNGPAAQLGPYVEPVHLQIVCRQLWTNLPLERTIIQAEDVSEFGDVDQALTSFYESVLGQVIGQTEAGERAVRVWFNERLITPARTRGLVYRGETETDGLPNEAVDLLAKGYIIRADIRGNDIWYELAHDRLVEPVLSANHAWELNYHNPIAVARQAWLESGHAPHRLLTGIDLEEAQTYAEENSKDLTTDEYEFLAESIRQDTLEQEKQKLATIRRRNTIIATVSVIIVLAFLAVWGFISAEQASQARDVAREERQEAEEAEYKAILERDRAATAEAQAEYQRATAEAASTAAIRERDRAEGAQREAARQRSAAEVARGNAFNALATAEADRNSAIEARATLATNLESILAQPTLPPSLPLTEQSNANQSSTPPPPRDDSATAEAIQAQLSEIRATQTAVAELIACAVAPPREFRAVWEKYQDQLGCPSEAFPVEGFFAEQPFERGRMFWAGASGQFVVTVGVDTGSWYIFDRPVWPQDPEEIPCQIDVPETLYKPVRGFGGLWCTQAEIRQAIGFATDVEFEVENGNLLQEFESGIMVRDSQGFIYILFISDGGYIREMVSG